jgi:3-oxoacyl-[acyl-carrier-protein] synthase-3
MNRITPLWTDKGMSMSGWGHYFPRRMDLQPPETVPPPTKAQQVVLGDVLGVLSRHVADEDETILMMATHAARRALRQAGRDPADVDLVIMTSSTGREWVPDIAPRLAGALGAYRALAFNLGGACIGFVHGVHTAASFLAAQGLSCAVVVSSERFTTRFNDAGWGDRMAGDGAGAVVIEAAAAGSGVLHDSVLLSFGEYADLIKVGTNSGLVRTLPGIADIAVKTASQAIDIVLDRNGLVLSDVDWVVVHPGSHRVLEAIREHLDIDPRYVLSNFAHRGSTASATVPTSVSESITSGVLRPGDLVLTPAMGGGWFTGALLFTL